LAEREGWFLQKYKVESDVSDCGDLGTGLMVRNEVLELYRDDIPILSGYWIVSSSDMYVLHRRTGVSDN
jgi:hypothetical protein